MAWGVGGMADEADLRLEGRFRGGLPPGSSAVANEGKRAIPCI